MAIKRGALRMHRRCLGATGVVQEAGVAVATVDLDEAEAAGAERLNVVGGAEFRDFVPISIAARMTDVPAVRLHFGRQSSA